MARKIEAVKHAIGQKARDHSNSLFGVSIFHGRQRLADFGAGNPVQDSRRRSLHSRERHRDIHDRKKSRENGDFPARGERASLSAIIVLHDGPNCLRSLRGANARAA